MSDSFKLRSLARCRILTSSLSVLILKAEDKEGKKLYTLEDKPTLMRSVDPEIVARIAQQILDVIPIEEWEKKNK